MVKGKKFLITGLSIRTVKLLYQENQIELISLHTFKAWLSVRAQKVGTNKLSNY